MALLLLKIILILCLQSVRANIKTLYVVVQAPFPDETAAPAWDGGPSLIPSVRLALEQINNRNDMVADYYLKLAVSDSGCNLYLKAQFGQFQNIIGSPNTVVGVIGPACSEAALATAPVQNKLQLVQITTATTPLLDDQTKYPFTFGIVSSSSIYVDTILQLVMENGWASMAILYEIGRRYHTFTHTLFVQRFPPELIVFSSGISPEYIPLEEILNTKTRVIIVLASGTQARLVMCLAYHQQLLFPAFQFLFIDRLMGHFVAPSTVSHRGKTYKCSKDEMMSAINGSILNHYDLVPVEPNTTLVSQSTFAEYEAQYEKKRQEYGQKYSVNTPPDIWANPFYDAMWALALSLNSCIPEIDQEFSDLSCIRKEIYNINFQGTTGNVTFDNVTGHASTVIGVHQVSGGNMCLVGHFSDNKITLNGKGSFIESSFEVEIVTVPLPYRMITLLVAAIALISTIFFHIINIWKREHNSIKATSPNLNNFAFVGCYMVIASMVIIQRGFNDGDISSGLCNALVWSSNISYTLIFGTICVKCWRLYRIFHHTFKRDKILSDGALALFLMCLVSLDVALCTIHTLVSPATIIELDSVHTRGTETVIRVCQIGYNWLFFTETVYKGLLTFTVVCLSIHNRHIKKKNFKHTKNITILVYSLTILLLLGVPLYMLISYRPSLFILAYIVVCVILSGMLFLDVFFLFLPPSIPLLITWIQSINQKYLKSKIPKVNA